MNREQYIMKAFLFARYSGNVTWKMMNIKNLINKITVEVDSAMKILDLDKEGSDVHYPEVRKLGRPATTGGTRTKTPALSKQQ